MFDDHPAFELLDGKQVFPYDWLNDIAKLSHIGLPSREEFFSKLKNETCSESEYKHAERIFKEFNCQCFKDFMIKYNMDDTGKLADCFEALRTYMLENYNLDPAYYLSLPQMAASAFKLQLMRDNRKGIPKYCHLLSDPAMYKFFKDGMRGGISCISTRYARANNPYMHDFDPTKPISYILYLDANNLYGLAQTMPLPISNFEWMDRSLFDKSAEELTEWILSTNEDDDIGFYVDVDIDVPKEIHDKFNDYPLLPEQRTLFPDLLGPTQTSILKAMNDSVPDHEQKLVATLDTKYHYHIFMPYLKFCLQQGYKLLKIHEGLSFKQGPIVRTYIEKTAELRKLAGADECKANKAKMMANACFGKFIENPQKRSDIKLFSNEEKAIKYIQKPHCLRFETFDNVCFIKFVKYVKWEL